MFKLIFGFLLMRCLLLGCSDNSVKAEGEGNSNHGGRADSTYSQKQEAKLNSQSQSKKNPRRSRYRGRMSTEIVFLLLNIEDAESHEKAVIIVDNSDWLAKAKEIGLPAVEGKAYTDYMAEHDLDSFVLSPELFKKFKAQAAPAADSSLNALSNEQIMDKYFVELDQTHVAKDEALRGNKAFLRALLERNWTLCIDCESGCLTADAPF